ncbi:hypothetical protein PVAP13_1KG483100 [Panicum virgatum]|uniref:Uncharacterized protein n=1 Tax=Panicum virgatum TaxID=38727 RepID=A0A8T0XI37_PANVG|nr:hypothetical protein PVAP13_1KG483100 [Panicum virgatum]
MHMRARSGAPPPTRSGDRLGRSFPFPAAITSPAINPPPPPVPSLPRQAGEQARGDRGKPRKAAAAAASQPSSPRLFLLASVPFPSFAQGMEMKKIACAVLVAASATVALAADAPAPAPTSGSSAVAPAVGAALGAAVTSFFAYYIQ